MATAPGDHNRAITLAAKAALTPLDFRRKGQSRVWLADQGFWLLVVEFQPSDRAKGSFLNVATHWLWHPPSPSEPHFHLSFDFGGRVAEFVDMATPAASGAAEALAELAAREAARLRAKLPSLEAAARVLAAAEAERVSSRQPAAWKTNDAAIAAALTGQAGAAARMFDAILATPLPPSWGLHESVRALLPLVDDSPAFRAKVIAAIAERRSAFRLPAIEAPFA